MKYIILLLSIGSSFASDKVVYGKDNRTDVYEVESFFWQSISDSTAAMVPKSKMVIKEGMINIEGETLKDAEGLCPGEKFENQKTPAFCSGFLFGEKLLITAGHCGTKRYCETQDWVFGMYQKRRTNELTVPIENIYGCKEVIARTQNSETKEDWAIIELDRRVEGIDHVLVRTEGKVMPGEPLVVIGHPSGLPTKVSPGAFVRKNENKYFFEANTDTFGGNSGSAVFNANTGIVEGILVRGEIDYESDIVDGKKCSRVKKCEMDGCRGEDIQKIPPIVKFLQTGDY
ncbi:MAG: trypsin-like serine peptidase, partial [Bacteriovoracales bacterium]